jgi:hypothetical protein
MAKVAGFFLVAILVLSSIPFSSGFAPCHRHTIGVSSVTTSTTVPITESSLVSRISRRRIPPLQLGVQDAGSLTEGIQQQLQTPSNGFFTLIGMLPGMDADRLAAVVSLIDSWTPWNPELPLLSRMVLVGPMPLAFVSHMFSLSYPRKGYRDGLEPYPRGQYDPDKAKEYYAKHPRAVVQRLYEITRLSSRYLAALLVDKYLFRNEDSMRQQRVAELVDLITKLGPTAIKVGQALRNRQGRRC